MVASLPSSLVQRASYRGRRGAFHVAVRWLATGPWLLVLALTGGGCSLAYQLDTTLGKRDGADQAGSPRSVSPNATAAVPSESDLAMARAAVSEVLIKGASSVPWENPKT